MRHFITNLFHRLWIYVFRTQRNFFSQILLTVAAIVIAAGVVGIAAVMLTLIVLSFGLPDVRNLDELGLEKSTIILDRNGIQLYSIHGEENRKYVTLSDMAPHLIKATLAIEDERFYDHPGIDYIAIARAAVHNLFGLGSGGLQGGSTITQQLAKNSFLSPERTLLRKMREVILAMRLERTFTKDEILELYLNKIPYGNNAFGVELASQRYFGKTAHDLSLAESAILASLPKAPTRYSPYGNYKNSQLLVDPSVLEDRSIAAEIDLKTEEFVRGLIGANINLDNDKSVYLRGRVDLVVGRMEALGFITKDEMDRARTEALEKEFKPYGYGIKAPHFVFYVRNLLEAKYGEEMVERGGLQVTTTLDAALQETAETFIAEQGETNEKEWKAGNAALVAMNPNNGHIISMVGSRDFFNEDIDGKVNVTIRPRQPGSSFKPIVYATAFKQGYGPGTVIYDVETKFQPGDEDTPQPQNYDGTFRGPMTIREALGQSRNIPAIKAFFLAGGQEEIISLANRMGLTTLKSGGNYGWPLGIGAGEVTLLEMVQAFSVFSNEGNARFPVSILKVEDADGNVLEEWKEETSKGQNVLEPEIAYLITDILSDPSVNLGTRLNLPGRKAAVKTGTSNKRFKKDGKTVATEWKKDDILLPSNLWTFGYTPQLVTGVWVGNADGSPMKIGADGYNLAAPIWSHVMQEAHKDIPAEDWLVPENVRRVEISTLSGKLPSPKTPQDRIRSELFLKNHVPEEVENIYTEVLVDGITGNISTEFSPPDKIERRTYVSFEPVYPNNVWREGIEKWYSEQETQKLGKLFYGPLPQERDTLHTAQTYATAPTIRIISPAPSAVVSQGRVTVSTQVQGGNNMEEAVVEFFLDGFQKDTARRPPWTGAIPFRDKHADGKMHIIKARVTDGLGYSAEGTVSVIVTQ